MAESIVRARWMDNESDLLLPDGTQLHVQPRHVYEVPEATVQSNPEAWKVQADKSDDEPAERHGPQSKVEAPERAVDTAPREEG